MHGSGLDFHNSTMCFTGNFTVLSVKTERAWRLESRAKNTFTYLY